LNATPAPDAAQAAAHRLRISEIFLSLQGEARDAGWPSVFVRLTGCPLRCHYCDTAYAFQGGQWWTLDAIMDQVAHYGVRHVCVTGGEPLAQKRCVKLLQQLCDAGYQVSLETSGALDISAVDTRVSRIVDIKTPDSGEAARNLWENFEYLTAHDQLKLVICSRTDYEWARGILSTYHLPGRCDVLFSPSKDQISATELADWIVADRLPVKFQLQLHKLLWDDAPGR